jgi:hypothetical protein
MCLSNIFVNLVSFFKDIFFSVKKMIHNVPYNPYLKMSPEITDICQVHVPDVPDVSWLIFFVNLEVNCCMEISFLASRKRMFRTIQHAKVCSPQISLANQQSANLWDLQTFWKCGTLRIWDLRPKIFQD